MKTFLLSVFLLLTSVSVSQTDQEIKDYFNEVAGVSGQNNLSINKWNKQIKVFLDGYYTSQDLINVQNIISELNSITNNIKMTIVKNKSEANSFVYFGDFNGFNYKYLNNESPYVDCYGYCIIYGPPNSIYIDYVKIFINNKITVADKNHVIIEEISQSLGLPNDSWKYEDSVFYEGYSTIQQLSKIDKEIIKMLYK